ncbi:unnamed protein product [Amoebophrya sp. A25]|nr:unnamed protein product [Amoebophrya sp. A25]|eukprot:GSA25T00014424001.1
MSGKRRGGAQNGGGYSRDAVEAILRDVCQVDKQSSTHFPWEEKANGQLKFDVVNVEVQTPDVRRTIRKACVNFYSTTGKLLIQGPDGPAFDSWMKDQLLIPRPPAPAREATGTDYLANTGASAGGVAASTSDRQAQHVPGVHVRTPDFVANDRFANGNPPLNDQQVGVFSGAGSSSIVSCTTSKAPAPVNTFQQVGEGYSQEDVNAVVSRLVGREATWDAKPNGQKLLKLRNEDQLPEAAPLGTSLSLALNFYSTKGKLTAQGRDARLVAAWISDEIDVLRRNREREREKERQEQMKKLKMERERRQEECKRELKDLEANSMQQDQSMRERSPRRYLEDFSDDSSQNYSCDEADSDSSEDEKTEDQACEHCGLPRWRTQMVSKVTRKRIHHCRFRVLLQCSAPRCMRKWSTVAMVWEPVSDVWDEQYCQGCYPGDDPDLSNAKCGEILGYEKLDPEKRPQHDSTRPHDAARCGRCKMGLFCSFMR